MRSLPCVSGKTTERSADADGRGVEALEARLAILLPETYRESYERLEPTPMRSAGLKYGADGAVAWDQIWGGFCDLAMAGGPPHKGRLLDAGTEEAIDADFDRYSGVAEEICRGISMVTGLRAYVSPTPGWVSVACPGDAMAAWLMRAIVMENVSARRRGSVLELPAAPHFRIDREIKNVITVIAKTCHYWIGHTPADQQRAIAELLAALTRESPFVEPDLSRAEMRSRRIQLAARVGGELLAQTGLRRSDHEYEDWLGVDCQDVRLAVWMMRALVACNVLSRREDTVLFVPINPTVDPRGATVSRAVARVHRYARERGVCV